MLVLDRLDGVLEARVVELHHVRAGRAARRRRPRVRLTWTMSKPPEPRPRSSACTLTITSSPTSAAPTSATSAIAGRRAPVELDHEILLGAAPGRTGVEDGGTAQLQHRRSEAIARRDAPPATARRCVRPCPLDAHVDVALALRQVGELVCAIDHLGRDRLSAAARPRRVNTVSHAQRPGALASSTPSQGRRCARDPPLTIVPASAWRSERPRRPLVRRHRARSQRGRDEVAEQRRRALRAGLELGVELGGHEEGMVLELDRPRPGARRARCRRCVRPALCRRLRSRLLTS